MLFRNISSDFFLLHPFYSSIYLFSVLVLVWFLVWVFGLVCCFRTRSHYVAHDASLEFMIYSCLFLFDLQVCMCHCAWLMPPVMFWDPDWYCTWPQIRKFRILSKATILVRLLLDHLFVVLHYPCCYIVHSDSGNPKTVGAQFITSRVVFACHTETWTQGPIHARQISTTEMYPKVLRTYMC